MWRQVSGDSLCDSFCESVCDCVCDSFGDTISLGRDRAHSHGKSGDETRIDCGAAFTSHSDMPAKQAALATWSQPYVNSDNRWPCLVDQPRLFCPPR